eukprot:Lithocolla_globosa_v1_NODE_5966_length_1156_cov_4.195277.p2 type:complete len:106 gc:universal NODE_5966_length_1156_cov_4.195277:340-23(-)
MRHRPSFVQCREQVFRSKTPSQRRLSPPTLLQYDWPSPVPCGFYHETRKPASGAGRFVPTCFGNQRAKEQHFCWQLLKGNLFAHENISTPFVRAHPQVLPLSVTW